MKQKSSLLAIHGSIENIIRARKSVRTYASQPIPENVKQKI